MKKKIERFSRTGVKDMVRPNNLICEIKFGSHLYGTSTPQSDLDFKGVYLPEVNDVLLGHIPKTAGDNNGLKKLPGDLDCEYHTLHHFLHLARQGQTMAVDMLFAPDNCVYLDSKNGWIWSTFQRERQRFLTKNMYAFVGYARSQANKYSLKGERLTLLKTAIAVLNDPKGAKCFGELVDRLYLHKCISDKRTVDDNGIQEYQICGKWHGEGTPLEHVLTSMQNSADKYGTRSHDSSEAGGVDWKALSHAVRISKELIEIICFKTVSFPLIDADLILRIKKGEMPLEAVESILDGDLAFIELKMPQSLLPEAVDGEYWDRFLCTIMRKYINESL